MKMIKEHTQHVFLHDNLLDDDYFQEVSTYAHNLRLIAIDGIDRSPLWRIAGKPAFPDCSRQTYVWTDNVAGRKSLEGIDDISVFPTGSVLDKLIERIHEVAILSGLLGEPGKDWAGTVSRFYRYSLGSAVNWHRDSVLYTGAFICYLSTSWDQDWGGHLLCKDEGALDGKFFHPEPNRLILIKTPYPHSVTPITCPPEVARISFTGFFVKPEKVAQMVNQLRKDYE
jgi:hypothetical protein